MRIRVPSPSGPVTALLAEISKGNPQAASELISLVYEDLHRVADRYMRRERINHTIQTTVLVHDAYLRLVKQRSVNWQNRTHFFSVAAQVMRRLLIDHARAHAREKRGGGHQLFVLDEVLAFSPERSAQLLDLNDALEQLAKLDARQARIVELRFFGGLSVEETAQVLEISPITVKRDWSMAKGWLYQALRGSHGHHPTKVGNR